LVVLLTDQDVNLGVIFLQLSNFAVKIKKEIEESQSMIHKLKMSEKELKKHIKDLKKQIFSDKLGSIS